LGDPTHGFPRLFTNQGAGIGIFSSAFQEAESKPETDPGIVKVREGKSQEMLGTNCRINAKSGGRFSATGGDLEEHHTDRK